MADRVGQQLGNYRLLRILGHGAFAEVYLGEHQYLERPAAIKVLHVQMEPEVQEQFRREARIIAHLQHPHILQVLDFGIQDQTPYLVMEYTPGGTLRAKQPKGIRLSLEHISIYVKQIALALDHAHQQGVIHRDVKPDNLLLNAKLEVVLSDFGIAVVQQTLNSRSTQNLAGTPLYMAPEQIQHKPCAASDQYALGIMVYEWLTGEAPFQGSLYAVLNQHLYHPPPSLRARLPDLPAVVEEAVFKALAKDPEQRFARVEDFALALAEASLATQPLTLHRFPKQQAQGQRTLAPVSTSKEQEDAAATMHLTLMTAQPGEREQDEVPLIGSLPVTHHSPVSQPVKASLAQSNRQRFLRRVRAFWIEGVLDHSLHGASLISLGLQEQVDALANPWHLVLQHPDTAPRSFPLGTRITDVYDAANGELLILGAPGSGKTTLLLELARDLLVRAEQDEQHLMPVVFTMSSWKAKQRPLAEWMIEELISKYQVPRKLACTWIDADQILPLLDGLDEIAAESRMACIETINTYHNEHAFLSLVVASRSADYLAQTARLRLTSAVTIQSLTQQQVDDYLIRGGKALWALRMALQRDTALGELAETPLMLSILTLTYHNMPVEELLRGGIAPTRQQIFERYVERMLARRGAKASFLTEQTSKRLTWLAQHMQHHNQTVFFIEQMQPDWLQSGKPSQRFSSQRVSSFLMRIVVGLLNGMGIAILLGLISGLLSGLVSVVLNGVLFNSNIGGWDYVLTTGISGILIAIVIVGLFGGLMSGLKREIHLVEVISWSWKRMQQRWRYWLIGMFVGGLIFGLLSRESLQRGGGSYSLPLLSRLMIVLSGGLLGTMIGALLGGISHTTLDAHTRVRPNQGVWHSLRNSILVGGLSGIIAILFIATLSVWISGQLTIHVLVGTHPLENAMSLAASYSNGFHFGLPVALSIGLVYGGIAFFQHVNLRLLLWSSRQIPWNYVRFLDYAAEHILLRKVGGGYIFIHRFLLEYFASLDHSSVTDTGKTPKQQGG